MCIRDRFTDMVPLAGITNPIIPLGVPTHGFKRGPTNMISPVGGAETQDKQRPKRTIPSHQALCSHKEYGTIAEFISFWKLIFSILLLIRILYLEIPRHSWVFTAIQRDGLLTHKKPGGWRPPGLNQNFYNSPYYSAM